MKRFPLFFIVALFTSYAGMAQETPDTVLLSVIDQLAKSDLFEVSNTVGYTGEASPQNDRLADLVKRASEKDLLTLAADHGSAVVRLYALKGLLLMKVQLPDELAENMLNDTTQVVVLEGCEGRQKTVASVVARLFLHDPANKFRVTKRVSPKKLAERSRLVETRI